MLLVAIVNCVTIPTAKRTNPLAISDILDVSVVITWIAVLLEANRLTMTSLFAVAASNSGVVNLDLGSIQDIIPSNLSFMLNHVRENFWDGWDRIHHKDMRSDVVVLLIEASKKLHSMIFNLSLLKRISETTRTLCRTIANQIRPKTIEFIPKDANTYEILWQRNFLTWGKMLLAVTHICVTNFPEKI